MRGIEGEQVLLRIIVSESRSYDGRPLYRRIVEMLREDGFAGATVLKGIAGFGHDRRMHSAALEVTAESDDGVIMAIEHARRPLAAVQFHPESIMSLEADVGLRLLRNVVTGLAAPP